MSIGALADEMLDLVRAETRTKIASAESTPEQTVSAPKTELGQLLCKLAEDLRRISKQNSISVTELEEFVRGGA